MKKAVIYISFCIISILILLFSFSNPSLESKLCSEIKKHDSQCDRIYYIDSNSNLVFYQNNTKLMYAVTNNDMSKINFVAGGLELTQFKNVTEAYQWYGSTNPAERLSILWGISNDNVKSIVLDSENNIQPNKVKIQDNVWLWYATFEKSELNMPIKVSGYNEKGRKL